MREIEKKEAGMLNFAREVESSRKLYESFLQRVKETNEAQNLQISKHLVFILEERLINGEKILFQQQLIKWKKKLEKLWKKMVTIKYS